MRFITLALAFITLTSCSSHHKRLEKYKKQNEKSSENIYLTEITINKFTVNPNQKNKRKQKICRKVKGCLQVCKHLGLSNCKKIPARKIVSVWLDKAILYDSWEPASADLNLIISESDVASFLKKRDKQNRVIRTLLRAGVWADCSVDNKNLFFGGDFPALYLSSVAKNLTEEEEVTEEADDELVSPVAEDTLTEEEEVTEEADDELISPVAEGDLTEEEVTEEAGRGVLSEVVEPEIISDRGKTKKIIDASIMPFDFLVFRGFIKKCFDNTFTFSEKAAQAQNKDAFKMGHQALAEACGYNDECVRLAYCSIGSESVWAELPKEIQACDYDSFKGILP